MYDLIVTFILCGFLAVAIICFSLWFQQRHGYQKARYQLEIDKASFLGELKAKEEQLRIEYQNQRNLLQDDFDKKNINQDAKFKARLDEINSESVTKAYIKDKIKWVLASLTYNNFTLQKENLEKFFAVLAKNDVPISKSEQTEYHRQLKEEFEKVLRRNLEREEQIRIKAQMKEEMQLEKERELEIKRLQNQQLAIEQALTIALRKAKDEHDAEVERLQAQLEEVKGKERAVSQAQLTKAGHVYVISNFGSFGENIFKIGMTRRLEPYDRVKELGDASVPFPFDVHMMISADDAPKLENALHKEFRSQQLNKVNQRKEFFKVDIESIRAVVEKNFGKVEYTADPEALEYKQSLTMTEEDFKFLSEEEAKIENELITRGGIVLEE